MKYSKFPYISHIILILSISIVACAPTRTSTMVQSIETAVPATTNPTVAAPTVLPISQPMETKTASTTPITETNTKDKAHYISETYPDGSNVAPQTSFQKSWKLQNNGTTTWTTEYKLVLISSSVSNEYLGSPEAMPLSKAVAPGEIVDVSVSLIAPATNGQYKVTWQLRNSLDQPVPVDGYDLWTLINVGAPQSASTGNLNAAQSSTVSGITVDLISASFSEQTTSVSYCISLPSDANWMPQDMWLTANTATMSVGFSVAGSKSNSSTFATYRCYTSSTDIAVRVGESVLFSIGMIGKDGTLANDCPQAQQSLATQYPDLKFTCLPVTAGAFYTLTQKPQGMSDQEADRIIVDAIQQNIYGPWHFSITR